MILNISFHLIFCLTILQLLRFLPEKIALEKLALFKIVHMELCELVSKTSDFFQTVFAVVKVVFFLNTLFGAYNVCIALFNLEPSFAGNRLYVILMNIIWILITSTNFYCLAFTCEKTITKVKRNEKSIIARPNTSLKNRQLHDTQLWLTRCKEVHVSEDFREEVMKPV
jgi:hypothetical protein